MRVKAAVTWDAGAPFVLEDVELDQPKATEVLVEVVATGVCATDAGAAGGHMGVPFPIVLGHEASGIVKEVGEAVTYVKPGDHVVVACCLCGTCDNCLTGKPGSCEHIPRLNFGGAMEDGTKRLSKDGHEISTFFGQSTFATYAVTNEKNLIKVDKSLDLELLGPLGCGIVTGSATVLEGLKPKSGSTIAIYGCGAVGLSAVMAAKISGCLKIIAVDINDDRLKLAKELGATDVINSKAQDITEMVRSLTDGKGVHYGVDATGNSMVAKSALAALTNQGELCLIGAGYQEIGIDLNTEFLFGTKKLSGYIAGLVSSKYIVPRLIEYYKQGQFPFDKLVTFYDFEDINQAFEDSKTGITIKPILRIKK
ncbi:aryl-alcohol dehydrogenase [Erysipelothrix larvae]|uniref:Aryl-alcohol dehydrogenase n=1 Tax=Erysipelothrix larvae TaxID=1514105 RepID=A0A0X8GYI2_9FIRM|nr:NAD(P)-dependent alcohol dehydrogenase [Erysipelothrix larvae]AMC92764.1 aryl-alcohol dehydrogenase [Erysipelothrix larvae]